MDRTWVKCDDKSYVNLENADSIYVERVRGVAVEETRYYITIGMRDRTIRVTDTYRSLQEAFEELGVLMAETEGVIMWP